MSLNPPRKREILDVGARKEWQNAVHVGPAEQNIDTDIHGRAGGGEFTVPVHRDDLKITGGASGLDPLIEPLQPVERQADILEPDVMDACGEGRFQMLLRVLDSHVVARQHEDEA